jgi:hypothetical protein
MDWSGATAFIQTVGFPIFVAVMLLWRGERQNEGMSKALNALTLSIELDRAQRLGQRQSKRDDGAA